jgi:hypothetical protein
MVSLKLEIRADGILRFITKKCEMGKFKEYLAQQQHLQMQIQMIKKISANRPAAP